MATGRFSGKVAVITGSSRGIGKAIAIQLAMQGASIVLNGRNAERLRDAENEIRKIHDRVISICCDVSVAEESNKLIAAAVQTFGRLDVLVNNVGVSMRGNVADLNSVVFKMVFDSNVMGAVHPTISALKSLRESQGSLVFISSLAGIRGLPFLSAYSSSKMALRAFAESIRVEEKNKIHVGLVFPGMTQIEHNKETIAADGSKIPLESRANIKAQSMEHVARAVVSNIHNRKFITTLTTLGKLNALLQPLFPWLVEWLLIKNLDKFSAERSK